ncbi:MAG: hypothetical protein ACI843_002610 [Psychrobacter glaciei]|jgi:hypothetical protein
MTEFLCFLSDIKWGSILSPMASIFTAYIALKALNVWKTQKKTEICTKFLDDLTDEIHSLINTLQPSIEFFTYVKIAIQSREINSEIGDGLIEYINSCGDSDSAKLAEYLQPCQSHVSRIRSLSAKGQTLGLSDYSECMSVCSKLCNEYDRLLSLRIILAMKNTNWKLPESNRALKAVMANDPILIREAIAEINTTYLNFVSKSYSKFYN